MARALKKLTTFRYVVEEDRALPPEQQTVFLLAPMTGAQRLHAVDAVANGNNPQAWMVALRFGLKGWENFNDENGQVPFVPDINENISRLTMPQILELGQQIRDASVLAEEEKKT